MYMDVCICMYITERVGLKKDRDGGKKEPCFANTPLSFTFC